MLVCNVPEPDVLELPSLLPPEEIQEETLGNYHVVCSKKNKLGKGGYGDVFSGINTTTNEKVAVKRVRTDDPRHAREAACMKSIHHENVVTLFFSEYRGSHLFLIMELCADKDLNNFLRDRTVSQDSCVRFMQNIAKGINHLHEKAILHRDLKPNNILVQKNEVSGHVLKVGDMGLAARIPQSSASVSITGKVGTVGWQAPEVLMLAEGRKDAAYHYSRPADVFASGLVFLTLVTHRQGESLYPRTGMYHNRSIHASALYLLHKEIAIKLLV